MIAQIAWRNIWRNPVRSLVVIGAIAVGVWAAIFMSGFATGMAKGYINNAIVDMVSHMQAHHPGFLKDNEAQYALPEGMARAEEIAGMPEVKALSARIIVNGMVSSSKGARGIRIRGVEPEAEASVSAVNARITEGDYFSDEKRNPVLISEELAEKLGLKLRSRLVLTFQDVNGEIISAAFRVSGLFKTSNKQFDGSVIYVNRSDIAGLLAPGAEPFAHELAILLHDPEQVDALQSRLSALFPDWTIRNYGEISPDLQLYESQISSVSLIYLVVIMLALVFGIINTMLMAVLERVRELGMLMAIGMNKARVFLMIVLETCFLGLIGGPAGLVLGSITIAYLKTNGINLSAFSETLRMYGMAEVAYFEVDPVVYWQVPLMVAITALLSSLYPARKAIQLRPVEAIRKI